MFDAVHMNRATGRRRFLQGAGFLGAAMLSRPACAGGSIELDLPGGPDERDLTTNFPAERGDDPATNPAAVAGDSI